MAATSSNGLHSSQQQYGRPNKYRCHNFSKPNRSNEILNIYCEVEHNDGPMLLVIVERWVVTIRRIGNNETDITTDSNIENERSGCMNKSKSKK